MQRLLELNSVMAWLPKVWASQLLLEQVAATATVLLLEHVAVTAAVVLPLQRAATATLFLERAAVAALLLEHEAVMAVAVAVALRPESVASALLLERVAANGRGSCSPFGACGIRAPPGPCGSCA